MSEMRSLTDDMDCYHKAFGAYHRAADRYNVMSRWVDTQLREVVKSVVEVKHEMRVLSIGPGDGEIENEILKVLHDRKEPFTPIKATIVEPSIDMVNEYKRRVAADAAQQHDVTYDWRAQTLDGYLDRAENYGINFDFISTLHSIYYAVNMQASIKDLYDRLKPGGMMLIVVISDKSGFGQFGKNFPLMWGKRHHHPTSAEVQAACKNENIPISEEFVIKVRSNITSCFSDPKDMPEDGRQLLDFFTHVINFIDDAPPEMQKEILAFLGSDLCSEKRDGGQVYFNGDWKAMIVRH